jgi:hypothetical protein
MRRGWLSLYVAAFVAMALSAALVVAGSLGRLDAGSLRLLRVSWVLSGAAVILALASVLAPRRR